MPLLMCLETKTAFNMLQGEQSEKQYLTILKDFLFLGQIRYTRVVFFNIADQFRYNLKH